MAVRINHARTPGLRAGGKRGGWTASERASNEQIRPLRAAHGAQSDKDTLQTGNQGPSNEEAWCSLCRTQNGGTTGASSPGDGLSQPSFICPGQCDKVVMLFCPLTVFHHFCLFESFLVVARKAKKRMRCLIGRCIRCLSIQPIPFL